MNIKQFIYNEYAIKRKSQNTIAKEQDIPLSVLEYIIKNLNICYSRNKKKYVYNKDRFDLNSPIFWYYIGLIATDGYINPKNKVVAIRIKNPDSMRLLTSLINYFEYTGPLFKYSDCYEFRLIDKDLVDILQKCGIPSKNKTFDLAFPDNIPNEDCGRLFIRGVIDGDGSINSKMGKANKYIGGGVRILTASKNFILGLQKYILLITKIQSKITMYNYPSIEFNTKEGLCLLKWVYEGFDTYKLNCKYAKYQRIIHDKDIV